MMDSMTQEWIQVFLQIPIVGAFMWFALKQQERYLLALDRRDQSYCVAMERMTVVISSNTQALQMIEAQLSDKMTVLSGRMQILSDIRSDTQYLRGKMDEHTQYVRDRAKGLEDGG
jgi:hypothetical protein